MLVLPPREKIGAGSDALLRVDHARKQFGGVIAVNDVSFDVGAREIVALIGPNGAGKSTTFNLITGVLRTTGGTISVLGEEVENAPPQEIVELAIGKLAGRGFVSVDDGVATLTELGRNVLPWKGISSESIHARLAQAGKFKDVAKIRWGLFELAGLARTIHWSGTDAQKEKLAEAKAKVLTAITEAKQSLHAALAES